MNLPLGLTAFLVFSAVVFGTLSLALAWEATRDWLRRRQVAKRLRPALTDPSGVVDRRADNLIRQFEKPASLLSELTRGVPGLERARNLLTESRTDWSPETFVLISGGLALGLGFATLLLTNFLLIATLVAGVGAAAPYFMLRHRRAKRLMQFEEELPESIDLLTRAIRAGHPLAAGIRMVADEGPPTVAEDFRQTFEEQRFGLPFEDALLGMVDRTGLVDVRIFAIAVLTQREVGGNLAEILDKLAETIRGRFYIRRQLRVYTAQGRLSGYTLAALPVFVGLTIMLMQPDHIGLLFSTKLGWFMVTVALVLQLAGALWIRKIIDIEI